MNFISLNGRSWFFALLVSVWAATRIVCPTEAMGAPFRVAVLMLGDVRNEPVAGLKDGLKALGYQEGIEVIYEVRDAGGERRRLGELAADIVESRPDVATAAGGVEADALRAATAGSNLPVVFLSVASAVDRGLVASLNRSGNNLTGVDTNDTDLSAKRLWFIRTMFPRAKTVLIPNWPSLTPSAKALEVTQAKASGLGLKILAIEGESMEEVADAAKSLPSGSFDVIYVGMAAPAWQLLQTVFFPISMAHKAPIMGINRDHLVRGAAVAYACSRYETGKQAARLVQKIFNGVSPADIPVETPSRLEFVINRWVVDRLGITLPHRIWRLADDVVDIAVE